MFLDVKILDDPEGQTPVHVARVQFQNSKFQKKNSAPAWRFKSRRNKKRIAQFACKLRDESNEPN